MKTSLTTLAFSLGLLAATAANAALIGSADGNTVYDTDANLTWAANANLAATNIFGLSYGLNYGTDSYGNQSVINSDGRMTWGGAQKWIGAMNAANYMGYSDWRLPAVTDTGPSCNFSFNGTNCGFNSIGSEMSHLYYSELGNLGWFNTSGLTRPDSDYGLVNKGTFSNFQSMFYWSGTEYAPSPSSAWYFNFSVGSQDANYKDNYDFALVVRSGQVATVPVPAAAWLLGSGLLGLVGVARRKGA